MTAAGSITGWIEEKTGSFPSGQRGQTVNLMDLSFAGSNPALPIGALPIGAFRIDELGFDEFGFDELPIADGPTLVFEPRV